MSVKPSDIEVKVVTLLKEVVTFGNGNPRMTRIHSGKAMRAPQDDVERGGRGLVDD
jgi:hypothetical protein